ncbi:prolipoprotein diacylglyceryl transferase [Flavobacterium gossypii]|nr:prolipoprotein diacylglyceryl transferase [Flavobacterium gossypii]
MKKIYLREGESIEKLDTLFIYTFFATLLGARLGHVIFYQSELFREDFWSVFLPFKTKPHFEFTGFSGLASHGAAIAIIITMYFYSKNIIKRPLLWILDRIVIPVSCGAIFVRLGNFFNSEIVGNKTDSPMGIKFIRDSIKPDVAMIETKTNNANDAYHQIATNPEYAAILQQVTPKHPAQLYEAVGYIIVFIILYFAYWKTQAREKLGYLFGVFLVLLWTVRFVVEYVKESQGGIEESLGLFSTGQWLSIPFIIAGLYFIFSAEKKVNSL